MKLEKIIVVLLAFFFGFVLIFLLSKISGNSTDLNTGALAGENQKQTRAFDPKITGSTGSGDAMIELTPQVTGNNKLVVDFSVETHSVNLDLFNLKDITTLEYGGKVLKPVSAGRLGGHHSSGKIIFDVGEDIGNFKIRIKGVPEVQDRVYVWSAD